MGMFGGNKLRCPACKSENVTVQIMATDSVTTGKEKTKKSGNGLAGNAWNAGRGIMAISTLGLSNLVIPKAKGKAKTTVNTKTKTIMRKVCLCQDCGHDWIIQ